MALFIFANLAQTTLAGPISSGSVTANLAAGTGALFPNPASGQQFALTFVDAATGLITEIVYVTARSGDVVTMVRGQEGTTALAWAANDIAANFNTAGTQAAMIQVNQLQQQLGNYAVDTGAANSLTVSLTPAPASLASIIGSPIRVKVIHTNTGSSTLKVNTLAATIITTPGGGSVTAGQLQIGQIVELYYDGSTFQYPAGGQSGYSNLLAFSTPGTTTWTAPAGITRVNIQAVGGGGGGSGNSTVLAGAGGGGGEYRTAIVPVTPLTIYTIIVAAGGAGGGIGATGAGGGFSSFSNGATNFVVANGGSPGAIVPGVSSAGGAGGNGGTGTVGLIGGSGGDGGTASVILSGYGGAAAVLGTSSRGGFNSTGGGAGNSPGGGGPGNYDLIGLSGAAGGSGIVILQW